uniref:Uncharacterized protein n=1 Tax=Arundo donax TaxID=35708 RepID=A0A0A9AZ39_ARUDO
MTSGIFKPHRILLSLPLSRSLKSWFLRRMVLRLPLSHIDLKLYQASSMRLSKTLLWRVQSKH